MSSPPAQDCAAQAAAVMKESSLDAELKARKLVFTFIKKRAPDFADDDSGKNMWEIISDPSFDKTYDPSAEDLLNMLGGHPVRRKGRTFNMYPVDGKVFITDDEWESMMDLAGTYELPTPSNWNEV